MASGAYLHVGVRSQAMSRWVDTHMLYVCMRLYVWRERERDSEHGQLNSALLRPENLVIVEKSTCSVLFNTQMSNV